MPATVSGGEFEVRPKVAYLVKTTDGEIEVTAGAKSVLSFQIEARGDFEIALDAAQ